MYNHNKAQQSKNRVHISWDILYGRRRFLFVSRAWNMHHQRDHSPFTLGGRSYSVFWYFPWVTKTAGRTVPFLMVFGKPIDTSKLSFNSKSIEEVKEYKYLGNIISSIKRLSTQSWGWWVKTPSRPLQRHCNVGNWSKSIHLLILIAVKPEYSGQIKSILRQVMPWIRKASAVMPWISYVSVRVFHEDRFLILTSSPYWHNRYKKMQI